MLQSSIHNSKKKGPTCHPGSQSSIKPTQENFKVVENHIKTFFSDFSEWLRFFIDIVKRYAQQIPDCSPKSSKCKTLRSFFLQTKTLLQFIPLPAGSSVTRQMMSLVNGGSAAQMGAIHTTTRSFISYFTSFFFHSCCFHSSHSSV